MTKETIQTVREINTGIYGRMHSSVGISKESYYNSQTEMQIFNTYYTFVFGDVLLQSNHVDSERTWLAYDARDRPNLTKLPLDTKNYIAIDEPTLPAEAERLKKEVQERIADRLRMFPNDQ